MALSDIDQEGWVLDGAHSRWSNLVLRLLCELLMIEVLFRLEVSGGEVLICRRSRAHIKFNYKCPVI